LVSSARTSVRNYRQEGQRTVTSHDLDVGTETYCWVLGSALRTSKNRASATPTHDPRPTVQYNITGYID